MTVWWDCGQGIHSQLDGILQGGVPCGVQVRPKLADM